MKVVFLDIDGVICTQEEIFHDPEKKKSGEIKVEDYMSRELYTVKPAATTLDCMALMTNKYIRHIPVLDHNKIVGIVSIGDIVNTIIHEQKITIEDLERYITSSGYGHKL